MWRGCNHEGGQRSQRRMRCCFRKWLLCKGQLQRFPAFLELCSILMLSHGIKAPEVGVRQQARKGPGHLGYTRKRRLDFRLPYSFESPSDGLCPCDLTGSEVPSFKYPDSSKWLTSPTNTLPGLGMSENPYRRETPHFAEGQSLNPGVVQQGKSSQGGPGLPPALQQPPSSPCPTSGHNACAVGPWYPSADTASGDSSFWAFPKAQPISAAGSEKGLLNAQARHAELHLPRPCGPQMAAAPAWEGWTHWTHGNM